MSWTGTKYANSTSNSTTATVEVPSSASKFTITAYPVASASGTAYSAAAAGTIALTAKVPGCDVAETVYASDGTTAVSFDATASAPQSITIENLAATKFVATPSTLSSGKYVRLAVTFG